MLKQFLFIFFVTILAACAQPSNKKEDTASFVQWNNKAPSCEQFQYWAHSGLSFLFYFGPDRYINTEDATSFVLSKEKLLIALELVQNFCQRKEGSYNKHFLLQDEQVLVKFKNQERKSKKIESEALSVWARIEAIDSGRQIDGENWRIRIHTPSWSHKNSHWNRYCRVNKEESEEALQQEACIEFSRMAIAAHEFLSHPNVSLESTFDFTVSRYLLYLSSFVSEQRSEVFVHFSTEAREEMHGKVMRFVNSMKKMSLEEDFESFIQEELLQRIELIETFFPYLELGPRDFDISHLILWKEKLKKSLNNE